MFRTMMLVFGLVLLIPGGGYIAWQKFKEVPEVAAALDDLGATVQGVGRLAKAVSAGSQQVTTTAGVPITRMSDEIAPEWASVRKAMVSPNDFDAFMLHDSFDRHRMVRFTLQVSPEEVLAEGEALPEAEWLDILMEARAVKVGLQACALLPESFAKGCDLRDISVGKRDDATGRYPLNVSLKFIETAPLGLLPDPGSQPEIVRTRVTLDPIEVGPGKMAEALGRLTTAAEQACVLRRAKFGNCALSLVTLDARGEGKIEMSLLLPKAEIVLHEMAVAEGAAAN
ncbi:MAG: hypothetical protein R3D78_10135 [Paracoccaceae bacterium]